MHGTNDRPLRMQVWQRRLCRWFAVAAMLSIAVDTSPWWEALRPLKNCIRPALIWTGLWQGQWPLFAPNPYINNSWISVEFYVDGTNQPLLSADHQPLLWNSPIWSRASVAEKFHRFRHLDFYNHLPGAPEEVRGDFANYVARVMLGPEYRPLIDEEAGANANPTADSVPQSAAIELRMFSNRMEIVMPDDGSLPAPDETTWMSVSRLLVSRRYAP